MLVERYSLLKLLKFSSLVALLNFATHLNVGHAASLHDEFQRIDPHTESGSGNSVANTCRAVAGSARGWPNARATLKLKQRNGVSKLKIRVRNAMPNTLYTVWLRVKGVMEIGPSGTKEAFGGSPLRPGAGSTPLAATDDIEGLVAITPAAKLTGGPLAGMGDDGYGSADVHAVANAFMTNSRGNASHVWNLDFPLLGGAYPFHNYHSETMLWDVPPVAIAGAPAPFTLRIASHCEDGRAHGLDPNYREGWFQWLHGNGDW